MSSASGNLSGYLPLQFGPVELWPTEVRVHEAFGFVATEGRKWFPFLLNQDKLPGRVLESKKANVPGLAPYTVAQLIAVAQAMERIARDNGKDTDNIIYKVCSSIRDTYDLALTLA